MRRVWRRSSSGRWRARIGRRDGAGGVGGRSRVDELGEAGAQEASVGASEEEGGPEAEVGDPIAVALGAPLDEPVEAQLAELVAEPALAELVRSEPEERREVGSQIASSEAGRLEPEDDKRRQEGLGPLIGEPEGRRPLAVDLAGLGEPSRGRLAEGRIVADSLDVEETSVAVCADLPQDRSRPHMSSCNGS